MSDRQFTPQLTREKALSFASRYEVSADEAALEAGRKIKAGECSRVHLGSIFEWKTKGRGRSRLACNTDSQVAEACGLRLSPKNLDPPSLF